MNPFAGTTCPGSATVKSNTNESACCRDYRKLGYGIDKTISTNSGETAAESVAVPFEAVTPIYESLGFKLDYEKLKANRPVIAEMLR